MRSGRRAQPRCDYQRWLPHEVPNEGAVVEAHLDADSGSTEGRPWQSPQPAAHLAQRHE
jgi:hypothetical protein